MISCDILWFYHMTYLSPSDLLSMIIFLWKPQEELNTSFLKTDFGTRDEFNHRIVSNSQLLSIGGWRLGQLCQAFLRNLPDLVRFAYWVEMRISVESTGRIAEKISDYLPPCGCSPMCHFVKAACFVETNTFWLLLGSVQPAEKPSWILFSLMNHPPTGQLNSGWGHFVLGEGDTELEGSILSLRPQAIYSVIRNIMFWLKSWSHLIQCQ